MKRRIDSLQQAHARLTMYLPVAKSELEKTGVIQLFEICFELTWKTARDILTVRGVKNINSATSVLRELHLEGWLNDINVKKWYHYRDLRNQTVHTYNGEFALSLFDQLHDFSADLKMLIDILQRHDESG